MNTTHTSSFATHMKNGLRGSVINDGSLRLSTAALAAGTCLAITVVVFGGVLLAALVLPPVREQVDEIIAIAIVIHALVCLLALVAIIKRYKVTPTQLGITRPTWRLTHLLWQIPIAMIALIIVQATMFVALGGKDPVPDHSVSDGMMELSPVFALLGFIGTAVLTPIWEELFFRGFLFGSVQARWGTGLAIAVSAVIFAIAHGVPIVLPYMFTLGVILAALRIFHKSLWGPLALHVTINSIVSIGVLVAVF